MSKALEKEQSQVPDYKLMKCDWRGAMTLGEGINDAEHATILAALRFYKESGMGDPSNRSDIIHDIATNCDTVISLDADAIDALCERINF
jgi:hypothetical protein